MIDLFGFVNTNASKNGIFFLLVTLATWKDPSSLIKKSNL